jgi:DNA-binding transcriptional MerR regulator
MFRIGDFSRIARVSTRLLRYYDGVGLLSPAWTDPATGYRYYAADQLWRLNRILALKELGLSLERISRLLDDDISSDEIRGMFLTRKAELERTVSEETQRLRNVESRLRQIDEHGPAGEFDVVVKSVEPADFLSLRTSFASFDDAIPVVRRVAEIDARKLPERVRDALVVVAHSDYDDENLDLEIGYTLNDRADAAVRLAAGVELTPSELPGVETMATLVRSGPGDQSHLGFGALGLWLDANGYEIAGPSRERFLELPFRQPDPRHAVIEIQFPVVRAPRIA